MALPDIVQTASPILAFASSEAVFAPESILSGSGTYERGVLAHELAHVVQKRQRARSAMASPGASSVVLEREAVSVSVAFWEGSPCPPLSGDDELAPRFWGPAGHYYTVYFVAREAGLTDEVALKLAFFAQMADQVSELDAKTVGIEWFCKILKTEPKFRMELDKKVLAVQAGLHCLTGRTGHVETTMRLDRLRKIDKAHPDAYLQFGLGLHALGDSFAHRKSDDKEAQLFPGPQGHFQVNSTTGTEFDNISNRQLLYTDYTIAMLKVIHECFAPGTDLSVIDMAKKLIKVTAEPTEARQIELLTSFFKPGDSFDPFGVEPIPWKDFNARHPRKTQPSMYDRAYKLGCEWAYV